MNLSLHTPQIIWLILIFIGLGISITEHGTTETKTNNFWTDFIAVMVGFVLLYWGGFFS